MIQCFFIVIVLYMRVHSVYFSTKTAYESTAFIEQKKLFPSRIQPTYINYLGRHGSRTPNTKTVKEMKKFIKKIEEIQGSVNYFTGFNLAFSVRKDKNLTQHGKIQMYEIGERFRVRFPGLFDSNCPICGDFNFYSTCTERAIKSMHHFIGGMFKPAQHTCTVPIFNVKDCTNNNFLRFFDYCQHYSSIQECLDMHSKEQEKFINSLLGNNLISKIETQFGIDQGKLDFSDVKALYSICSHYIFNNMTTIDGEVCEFFDKESLTEMEYFNDISQFYKLGNAFEINIQMSCLLFKNIFTSISNALESCTESCCIHSGNCFNRNGGDFRFGHAETVIPILGYLGLLGGNASKNFLMMDDEYFINHDNFESLKDNRIFRAGYFAPMGGNLAFVVGCSKLNNQGVVVVLLNERPVELPCCKGSWIHNEERGEIFPICTKTKFIECFKSMALACNFDEFCSKEYKCSNENNS